MPKYTRLEQWNEEGYALEICRLSDIPLGPEDRLLYAWPNGGPILIARAPVRLERIVSPFKTKFGRRARRTH